MKHRGLVQNSPPIPSDLASVRWSDPKKVTHLQSVLLHLSSMSIVIKSPFFGCEFDYVTTPIFAAAYDELRHPHSHAELGRRSPWPHWYLSRGKRLRLVEG